VSGRLVDLIGAEPVVPDPAAMDAEDRLEQIKAQLEAVADGRTVVHTKKPAIQPAEHAPLANGKRRTLTDEERRDAKHAVTRELEAVLYFEAAQVGDMLEELLTLKPPKNWSAKSKLDFIGRKATVLMKFIDRVEGLPVQRQRNVDGEDNDVGVDLRHVPPAVLERTLEKMMVARMQAHMVESTAEEVPAEAGETE
jgi:hypothetical protein